MQCDAPVLKKKVFEAPQGLAMLILRVALQYNLAVGNRKTEDRGLARAGLHCYSINQFSIAKPE